MGLQACFAVGVVLLVAVAVAAVYLARINAGLRARIAVNKWEVNKHRLVIQNMDEGLVFANAQDIVTNVNRWFLEKIGSPYESLVGKSLWELHGVTSGIERLREVIAGFRDGTRTESYRIQQQLFGMHVVLHVQGVFDDTRYQGVVLDIADVTQFVTGQEEMLRLMEDANQAKAELSGYVEALQSANQCLEEFSEAAETATRAKSQFLANMSHEIRTPMTAILGFTDILLDDLKSPKPPDPQRTAWQIDAAETVKRNGEHLLQLINDILDLSKIEAGKIQVERISWSPRQIVAEVVSLMHVRADAKGLSIKDVYEGPLPETIVTDPARLRQILVNLVGNAIKFTQQGGIRIVARLVRESGKEPVIRFAVIDSGMGISEADLGRVFEPFTQVDASASRKYEGTGLGLSISRQLARALGGDVTASSCLGKGSTFTVTVATGSLEGVLLVEYVDAPRSSGSDSNVSAPSPAPKLGYRILLAEDMPDNQRLMARILRGAGMDVTIVGDGQEAVQKALASESPDPAANGQAIKPFDVILMDVQMPSMDGHEATRRLRQTGYCRPIIALTAHAMRGDRQRSLDAGCDDYLSKPVDTRLLLESVTRWAASGRQVLQEAGRE